MNVLIAILAGIVGAAAGVIAACFATYYACVLIDAIRGAKGGDGVVTVGWLFLFLTAPLGGIAGAVLGVVLVRTLWS